MDSDDMLHPDGIRSLIEAESEFPEADFIKGSHTVLLEDGREVETKLAVLRRDKAGILMCGGEFMKEITRQHGVYFAALYSTEFIRKHNIEFNVLITANGIDDQPFLMQVMLHGKGVYIDAPIYRYRLFLQSTSNTVKTSDKVLKADLEALKEFRKYMDLADDVLLFREIGKFYQFACFGTLRHIILSKRTGRKVWLAEMKGIAPKIKGYDRLSRVLSFCYNYFPFVIKLY